MVGIWCMHWLSAVVYYSLMLFSLEFLFLSSMYQRESVNHIDFRILTQAGYLVYTRKGRPSGSAQQPLWQNQQRSSPPARTRPDSAE